MTPTPQLRDPDEDQWPLKLHFGCGGVYLRGYTNTDIDGQLASDNRLQRLANETEISDYYARLEGNYDTLKPARPTVFDIRMDMGRTPYEAKQIDKIIAIQAFEHLSPVAAIRALDHWRYILRRGGVLIVTVPDIAESLEWIERDDRRAFALRHLRGSLRTIHSRHKAWYTRETLVELLEYYGFSVMSLSNIHAYPAVCLKGYRR